MKDSFYTPTSLADHLISFIKEPKINNVADFCIGDGELLRSAIKKWPKIKCYGTDISDKAVGDIKSKHPKWLISKCDFLSEKSRNQTKALKKINKFDLILLNPPFSCIGGSRENIEFCGKQFEVSTAMLFLLHAIKYLSSDGTIYAILPNSVAYSQKDEAIWKQLQLQYNLNVLEESNTLHFDKCSARIILISLNSKISNKKVAKIKTLKYNLDGLSIFRGKIGMHKIDENQTKGHYLIHSTNLQNNSIVDIKIKIQNHLSKITGPAVLIPRVGLPNSNKICSISKNKTFILSDCILAIKTNSEKDSSELKEILIKNWQNLNNLYKGTGARYITVERLKEFLKIS